MLLVLVAVTGSSPTVARAQSCADPLDAPLPLRVADGPSGGAADAGTPAADAPGTAFLLSALVPGSAQYRAGSARWIAYATAEVAGWVFWNRARARGGDRRNEYRDLAWTSARTFSGERVDGEFEYYERLIRFTRSGVFDRSEAPGLQPEEDPGTFNGDAWALARQIHFRPGTAPEPGDPSFEAALDFYRERAAPEAFLWDWTGKEDDQRRFAELVEESDDAFGRASLFAGGLVFNHLVSALDAFLAARARTSSGLSVSLGSEWTPPRFGSRPAMAVWAEVRLR